MPLQAGFQVLGLVVTLFIALVTGAATGKNRLLHAWKNEQFMFNIKVCTQCSLTFIVLGLLLNTAKIFEPLNDFELFDDAPFWSIPDESPKKDLNETSAVEMTMLQS